MIRRSTRAFSSERVAADEAEPSATKHVPADSSFTKCLPAEPPLKQLRVMLLRQHNLMQRDAIKKARLDAVDDDLIVGDEEDANRRKQVIAVKKEEVVDVDEQIENIIETAEKHSLMIPMKKEEVVDVRENNIEDDDEVEYLPNVNDREYLPDDNDEDYVPNDNDAEYSPDEDSLPDDEEEQYLPDGNEEEDVDEEALTEALELNKHFESAANKKVHRKKMRPPKEQQSFVKQLCENYQELAEDKELLIETLCENMAQIKPPEPPQDYFVMNNINFQCVTCGAIKDTRPAMERHWQAKHGPRYLVCFACGMDFRTKTKLYKHEMRCNAADAVVVLQARARFVGRKGRSRPFLLPAAAAALRLKVKRKKVKREKEKHRCPLCPAEYVKKVSLQSHMIAHQGARPYQCHDCTQACTSYIGLNRHRNAKHSGQEFICDHCSRSFCSKSSLIQHLNTHEPLRRFSWELCGSRFAQRMALEQHKRRVHYNLPLPCACQICPNRYSRMNQLKVHMLKAHGMNLNTKNMQNAGEFKFAVVKFLQQPYPSIDEYICIPQSWMKERRVTDRKSLVAYPSENPSLTKKRLKKAEKVSDKWKLYMAIVKHETNSYEDANNYIAARRYDASIENRCRTTTGADQILLPSTTTEVNHSSLKRNKQSINHQKRFKVVNDVKLTNRCQYPSKSSESSNNKLTSVTSGPSTDVSSEKLIEVMEGKSSSTQKGYYQNSAVSSSICSTSSANTSQCLPVNYECIQQDFQATGLLGRSPPKVSVITKSPSVKNNTVQHTLNSSNQPFQSFSHLQQNQLLQSHQDRLIQYSHTQGIHEKPKETQVINPGTFSQNIAGNTFHASLNPLISSNQIFQNSQQPQGNQISSTYYDHLQRIGINNEIHRTTISNLQSLLPDFSINQCSQGFGQSTPYTVQNVANQFSQISNSSSVYQNQAQVLLTQEVPDRQSSEVNCTNSVPSSDSRTMYVPIALVSTSNLVDQSTVPTQHLDVNQPPVDGNHSQQEKIVDGSTEVTCIERSVSSEQCTENESSAIPSSQNQSVESLMERLHSDDKVTTGDVSSTQDLDDVNEQSSTKMNTEEELTNQSLFDQESQAVDSIANIEDHWLDRMADLFDKLNSDFLHTSKMAHELHESLVQSAKTFQCIASLSENIRKMKQRKATVETPKEVLVEVQKVAEKEQVVMGEKGKSDVDMADNKKEDNNEPNRSDDNDESSNNDKSTADDNDHDIDKDKNRDGGDKDEDKDKDEDADKDEEAPKKIRGCIRTFALPSEYNPKDTKWTLKYRKFDSKLGLVELVEKSRVYINAIRLAHCKRMSKDSKTLARMLLVEIFSQNALSVCSLTGARANCFDINGTNVRPGLDEHARMVILSFVEEHARQKGWGPLDTQSVVNSIRSKIQEVRAKYGQTT